jgi:ketosteroid isomerase-like protein
VPDGAATPDPGETPRPASDDPLEVMRRSLEAIVRRDFDAAVAAYSPDAVWDTNSNVGIFSGRESIRAFFADWTGAYESYEGEIVEALDLGYGVHYGVLHLRGQPKGTSGTVETRFVVVGLWADGQVKRYTVYNDIKKGRATAERLAEERGQAVSENMDLVRSIVGPWERGDYSSAEWAHAEIEYVIVDGPQPGNWTGLAGMAEAERHFLRGWSDFRAVAEDYRGLDDERVLVFTRASGRGKASGVDVGEISSEGAILFEMREGKIRRLVLYLDRANALADLGLEE